MWAPGSYKNDGQRTTAPAPNIGIEKYFFEAGEKILSRIKEHRNTVILPERTGPIADVLYSAAGNSADDQWYRKGIISYSFETGADRFITNPTTGAVTQTITGFQPCFSGRRHRWPDGRLQHQHDQRRSRSGDGVRLGQLRHGRVRVRLRDGHDTAERHDRDEHQQLARRADQLPLQLGQRGGGHPLHDGRLDADPVVADLQRPAGAWRRRGHLGQHRRSVGGQVDRQGHEGQRLGRARAAALHRQPGRRHGAGDAVADAGRSPRRSERSRPASMASTRPRRPRP